MQLLPVLLAEVGAVGLDDVEQFEHHGEDAVEVTLAMGAFELAAELGLGDSESVVVVVDVLGPGWKTRSAPAASAFSRSAARVRG